MNFDMQLRTCSTCRHWQRTCAVPNCDGVLQALCGIDSNAKVGSASCQNHELSRKPEIKTNPYVYTSMGLNTDALC
jgi:hypothetical protein